MVLTPVLSTQQPPACSPVPILPHSLPHMQPQASRENLSPTMSLSCSEHSCGSILLRVKARVFPVASEAPHDLLSVPAPLMPTPWHPAPAREASSSVLTLGARRWLWLSPTPGLAFCQEAVQLVVKTSYCSPDVLGSNPSSPVLSCVIMSKLFPVPCLSFPSVKWDNHRTDLTGMFESVSSSV